jgi:lipid-binding SYLF domain-containing protein
MKVSKVLSIGMAVFFVFVFSVGSMAQSPEAETSPEAEAMNQTGDQAADKEDAKEKTRAEQAAAVLTNQMEQTADKRIPSDLLSDAKCIAVFPSVVKAGFIVAAKRGNGLISCRHEDTQEWGSPAFFKITGASVGFQAGVQSASIIMLFMDQNGVDVLSSGKMSLGSAGVTVSAGPVGGNLGTEKLKSSVVTYGKSKGVFAGIDVEGSSLTFAKDSNDEAYAKELSPLDLLLNTDEVPESLTVFSNSLEQYAPKSEVEAEETNEMKKDVTNDEKNVKEEGKDDVQVQ